WTDRGVGNSRRPPFARAGRTTLCRRRSAESASPADPHCRGTGGHSPQISCTQISEKAMSNASASHLVVQTETLKSRALFYSGSGRALLFVLALLFATVSVRAEIKIRSLTNVIEGHAVGGVTVDLVGNIYVADFGDTVWKITPEGKRDVFASGFYGASGNAIDHEGNLLQSNFYGDSITKIDRKGQMKPFVSSGLSGPVGITLNRQTGDVYVANCRSNSIAKIATDG